MMTFSSQPREIKSLVLDFEEYGTKAEKFLDAFCKLYSTDEVGIALIDGYVAARHEELKAVEKLHENGFSSNDIVSIVASIN